jgi:hypothetical protein
MNAPGNSESDSPLPRRPPDAEWEVTWLGVGVGMDHGKGAGTTEPAPIS